MDATTPSQVIGCQGGLLAATSDGLYRFPLAAGGGGSPSWWIMVLVLAIGLGIAASA